MEQMDMNAKGRRRTSWLVLLVGSLLLVALLATAGSAATPGASTAGLAVNLQEAMAPVLSGQFGLIRRLPWIPHRPAPRSPYQPPDWIDPPDPGDPPPPPADWVPPRPPWFFRR